MLDGKGHNGTFQPIGQMFSWRSAARTLPRTLPISGPAQQPLEPIRRIRHSTTVSPGVTALQNEVVYRVAASVTA